MTSFTLHIEEDRIDTQDTYHEYLDFKSLEEAFDFVDRHVGGNDSDEWEFCSRAGAWERMAQSQGHFTNCEGEGSSYHTSYLYSVKV